MGARGSQGQAIGGGHRKNTYASETPFTDGERLYVSFGQNVGLFCYTLDGTLLWKKQWPPQPIYLDFGTASSPTVHGPRLSAPRQRGRVVHHRARRQNRSGDVAAARPATGFPRSSWTTPCVWTNEKRTEIVTLGHAMVISYDLDGKELWRVTGMSMPTASPVANGWLTTSDPARRATRTGRSSPSSPARLVTSRSPRA